MPWAWLRHLGSTRKALEPPTLPRGQRQTLASDRPRPATDPLAADGCPVAESATYQGRRAELFSLPVAPVLLCTDCPLFLGLGPPSQSSRSLRGAQVALGSVWLCDFDKLLNFSVPYSSSVTRRIIVPTPRAVRHG